MIKNRSTIIIIWLSIIGCTAYLSLFSPGTAFAEELCITYHVTSRQITEANDENIENKGSKSLIMVSLGKNYFYAKEGVRKLVFDFHNKRVIKINDSDKVYSDTSLFSDIGFRYMEFQNRLYLRNILNKASERSTGKTLSSPGIFNIESLFSMAKPGSSEQLITENKKEHGVEYSFNKETVVECKFSSRPLSDLEVSLFEKYLIYQCHLHPQIRKAIISTKLIPKYLKYSFKNSGKKIYVEMNLVKLSTEQRDSYVVPANYTKIYALPNKELASLIDKIMSGKGSVRRMEKSDFIKIADDLMYKGSYFDAMLVLFECGLQTGEGSPEKVNEVMSAGGKDDERWNIFLQCLDSKDRESAEKAMKTLESISRENLTHGYVVDIVIADNKVLLGDFDKAKELFLKVLEANPYIAGVYKDLGDPFHSSFDMVSAWQCWDTARFLYPNHKMLQQVNEYEQWLVKNFPDFFLPG